MKNEKQTKKQKHAAKPWSFSMRGGIKGINFQEIAETLSRKNPVAVVTLIPNKQKGTNTERKVAIVVHSSIKSKCWQTQVRTLENRFTTPSLAPACAKYYTREGYDIIVPENLESVNVILDELHSIRQCELPDKTEYTAAVNYPKV